MKLLILQEAVLIWVFKFKSVVFNSPPPPPQKKEFKVKTCLSHTLCCLIEWYRQFQPAIFKCSDWSGGFFFLALGHNLCKFVCVCIWVRILNDVQLAIFRPWALLPARFEKWKNIFFPYFLLFFHYFLSTVPIFFVFSLKNSIKIDYFFPVFWKT